MRLLLLFIALSISPLTVPGTAADTDSELEEKLKAVMILFDKSHGGLQEEIQSLELRVSQLDAENVKLTRELEAIRQENLNLKKQLLLRHPQGQPSNGADQVVAAELVASNSRYPSPDAGQPGGNRNPGIGPAKAVVEVPEGDRININTASREELMNLPLVNEFLADNIIAGRPWKSLEDLIKLQGVGLMKLRRIQPMLIAGPFGEKAEEIVSEKPVD